MPEPITPRGASAVQATPRPRHPSRLPSLRQLRDQEWRTLLATWRLLSRLVVENAKHHRADQADALAHQAVLVERELEAEFPGRWSRRRPGLLLEQATWWVAEEHAADVLDCQVCHLLSGGMPERIDLPTPSTSTA
jgi:hypothetical protein